jgi:hypothetical protein
MYALLLYCAALHYTMPHLVRQLTLICSLRLLYTFYTLYTSYHEYTQLLHTKQPGNRWLRMEWEIQFSEHVQLTEVMSVAKDSIIEAAAAAGVVVVLVASNKFDKLNALLQGCAAAERSSVSRRPTLLPAYNTSVDSLVSCTYVYINI